MRQLLECGGLLPLSPESGPHRYLTLIENIAILERRRGPPPSISGAQRRENCRSAAAGDRGYSFGEAIISAGNRGRAGYLSRHEKLVSRISRLRNVCL